MPRTCISYTNVPHPSCRKVVGLISRDGGCRPCPLFVTSQILKLLWYARQAGLQVSRPRWVNWDWAKEKKKWQVRCGGNHAVAVASSYSGLGCRRLGARPRESAGGRDLRGDGCVARHPPGRAPSLAVRSEKRAIDGNASVAADSGDRTRRRQQRWSSRRCVQHGGQIPRRYGAQPPPDVPHRSLSPPSSVEGPPVAPLNRGFGTLGPSPQISVEVARRYLSTRLQHREGRDPGPASFRRAA